MQSASDLRDRIFNSITTLYQHQLFKYEDANTPTHCEFIYLLQLVNLIGQDKQFPIHSKNNWIQFLREPQQPDGYFETSQNSNNTSRWALTANSIATLHQLGGDIRFPIYPARQFSNRQFTENWFYEIDKIYHQSSQQEKDAVISGKAILNTFTLLDKAYCDGLLADTHLIFFFKCCDAFARPASGFWLSDSVDIGDSKALIDALFRTQAYIFFGRNLPYPEQMIQSILKLQRRDGHFAQNPGCHLIGDLAAVTLLAHLNQVTKFKRFWIRRAVRRLMNAYHKTTVREIETLFQFYPDHPLLTEAILYGIESESRLTKTIALYYFSLIQALASLVIPDYKYTTTGWNLKNASPSFTFSEIS